MGILVMKLVGASSQGHFGHFETMRGSRYASEVRIHHLFNILFINDFNHLMACTFWCPLKTDDFYHIFTYLAYNDVTHNPPLLYPLNLDPAQLVPQIVRVSPVCGLDVL